MIGVSTLQSRRSCLRHGLILLAAATGVVSSACSSAKSAEFSCTDLTGLTADEIQTRKALEYVDRSPDPSKTCKNCQLYIVPGQSERCGGCVIAKGPFHPDGYCGSWVTTTS
jgi:hypothetical protein